MFFSLIFACSNFTHSLWPQLRSHFIKKKNKHNPVVIANFSTNLSGGHEILWSRVTQDDNNITSLWVLFTSCEMSQACSVGYCWYIRGRRQMKEYGWGTNSTSYISTFFILIPIVSVSSVFHCVLMEPYTFGVFYLIL